MNPERGESLAFKTKIAAHAQNLPTISTVVARLSKLIRDEAATAADFESIIRLDPSLTANLLRLANSAYFGLRREVTSVKLAVTLLGLKRLFELVTSASFARLLPARIPGYDMDATAFWRHNVSVAIIAEQLALSMQTPAPNLLFTAGLLHDVGKLAIGNLIMEEKIDLHTRLVEAQNDIIEVERSLLETDHQEVGASLAALWDLPDTVIWSARWHHMPSKAPADIDRNLVDLVHIANGLAHSSGYGNELDEVSRRIDNQAFVRIGVRVNTIEKVLATTEEQINQLVATFGQG
jgi:putative nucleotidyltransferase with HDIG domain